jgi:hypothetical protein
MKLTKNTLINLEIINDNSQDSFVINDKEYTIQQEQQYSESAVIITSDQNEAIQTLEQLDRELTGKQIEVFERFISLLETDVYADIISTISNASEESRDASTLLDDYIIKISEIYSQLFEEEYKERIINFIRRTCHCFSTAQLNIIN